MVRLYKTVETLLCPSMQAYDEHEDKPYFWAESTAMMYVLSEVSNASWAHVEDEEQAAGIVESLEGFLAPL
jgi:hypothetical protein